MLTYTFLIWTLFSNVLSDSNSQDAWRVPVPILQLDVPLPTGARTEEVVVHSALMHYLNCVADNKPTTTRHHRHRFENRTV